MSNGHNITPHVRKKKRTNERILGIWKKTLKVLLWKLCAMVPLSEIDDIAFLKNFSEMKGNQLTANYFPNKNSTYPHFGETIDKGKSKPRSPVDIDLFLDINLYVDVTYCCIPSKLCLDTPPSLWQIIPPWVD